MQETITQYRRKLAYFIHCCKEDTGFEESKKLYSDGEASEASDANKSQKAKPQTTASYANTEKGGKGKGGRMKIYVDPFILSSDKLLERILFYHDAQYF
jgi:hypothetical protein